MSVKQQPRRRMVTWDEKFARATADVKSLEKALKSARRDMWDLAQEARDHDYPVSVLARMMQYSAFWVSVNTAPKGTRRAKQKHRYGS